MQSRRDDTLEERYAIKFCFKIGNDATERMECFRLLLEHLAWIEHQFLSGIRFKEGRESVRDDESCWRRKEVNTPELIGQTVRAMLRFYYVEIFMKRFRRKRPALFKSGQWLFHQDNAPVYNSILVTNYLTKLDINTVPHPPFSPYLAPYDVWLFS